MRRPLTVLFVLAAILQPALVAGSCLDYDLVSLRGTLVRQIYPGPPDYESVTKGDKAEFYWVLVLDRRICVADSDSAYSRHYEREIQLVSGRDQYAQYRNLLGEKVIVTGTLRRGGAWDEKRLVLTGKEIQRTGPLP